MEISDYKFVVVKPSYGDVYDFCYKDLETIKNVDLLDTYINFRSKFEEKIYYKHFTKKINLPFKGLWNKKYYQTRYNKKEENLIFILSKPTFDIFNYGAIKYLRKKYKKAKIILFLNDIIKKNSMYYKNFNLFQNFDAVISFDYNDCKKYGFYNHPLVYSASKEQPKCEEDIDVYFCGRAKNRLNLIMSTFKLLKSKGLNCLFILRDVPKEKRENIDGLIYLDSFMSYEQNLEYIKRAKCLLEIMQEGGNGYTLRTCEAIAYNKKIITNNLILKNADFYDENMMSFFNLSKEIDIEFIKKEKSKYKDNNYFSPIKLLEKVSDILENGEKE